jgi:hypothetical protein
MPPPTPDEPSRWVLLVTDGTIIEYPPEVYVSEKLAQLEAERWAWLLSGGGWGEIVRPFEGRWEVGDKWIRLVQSIVEHESEEVWVGTYWGRDGSPDPEAELFATRDTAREWALDPVPGAISVDVYERPWFIGATYLVRGEEEYAVVHRAKRCV